MVLAALMVISASQTLLFAKKHKAKKEHAYAAAHSKKQPAANSHKHHAHHDGAAPVATAHDRRQQRAVNVEQYRALRQVELERAMAAGKYAYLEKSPAWANESLFFDKKMQLTVNADYHYATDCYGSSGSGSNSDVTRLAFGEQPIRLQDILLASRLIAAGNPAVVQSDIFDTQIGTSAANAGALGPKYLARTAADTLTLLGQVESYGVNLSLTRYVISNNISIGLDMPVLYKHNRLNIDYDFALPVDLRSVLHASSPVAGAASGAGLPFLRRYGNNPQRYLKDILKAKGITEVGGSAAGLGDIALFMTGHINSSKFDKLEAGLRFQLPTGKKQAMNKLWAPDLGNGGFSEISVFGNALVSYKKYLNPHVSLSAGCSLPAHVDRRVPKYFDVTGLANQPVKDYNTELAFNDRISFSAAGTNFKGFDSLIPNFGDTVSRVKVTRGAEIKMRLGNMVERFASRRGFLDVFYDFRAKMKDMASGLSSNLYDIESVRKHTNQLEHRLGFDYSHQFDLETRLRLGARYTVAGMNVQKAFDVVGSVNYAF